MKTFLAAAAAALLTAFLFLYHPRLHLVALCSKKLNFGQHAFQSDDMKKKSKCTRYRLFRSAPYKKDPDIDVDDEQIGQEPYE